MLVTCAYRVASPQTISRLHKRQLYSQNHGLPNLFRSKSRALSLTPLTLQQIPKRNSHPNLQQQPLKRPKTETSALRLIQPYSTMPSRLDSNVHLELTEVESKLRQLLLDVAAYIDDAPAKEDVTGVQVPKDIAKEKTVLRWTGGWVRDKLLNVASHDIDLAINKMTGEHFGLKMQDYLRIPGNAEKHGLTDKNDKSSTEGKSKRIAPGLHKIEANPEKSKNLETATTKIMGIDLDLVNLRKETYNEVSRNPHMEFGTAEEDAMRRDATVNAMFYNLHTCEVEDFTHKGFDDMAAEIIRTPLEPTRTFKDDPLRILRLIRFASRLDYVIEPETAKAMGDPTIQDVLKIKISRERVGIELEKMLRGPRPRMALELIDRFGLYRTVFTDPTGSLHSVPDTALFQPAYDFVESIIAGVPGVSEIIADTLLRDADERYLAWICTTVIPWADAPMVPHSKRPSFAAYLVAREGFKAPNKVCDVITASLSNGEEIRTIVARCANGLRRPETVNAADDPTARDTIGMALRRWGSTWRTQVLFNLVYEVVLGRVIEEDLLKAYARFLDHINYLNIQDVDTFKPLLKGTDLAKALGTKPGPWMKDALDVVMAWQLRNPDSTDPVAAIEAVKASQDEKTNSELPSRLASHFLQLTIPPFFSQNKPTSNALEASHLPAAWKDPGAQHALDLLRWSIGTMARKEIEAYWHLMVPPILKMIDDIDAAWKAKGCHYLALLLESIRASATDHIAAQKGTIKQTPSEFLRRTGYHNVFAEALFPMFAHIPSLTPEPEAVTLFQELFPAVMNLVLLLPAGIIKSDTRDDFLDKTLRGGILSPLVHFPTPSTYPELTTVLVSQLQKILGHMGIESVKHLPSIIPLLSTILQDPFVVSHRAITLSTLVALQATMMNAWPRIWGHCGAIMMGLSLCWGRCVEEDVSILQHVGEVKVALQDTVAMLNAVMQTVEDSSLKEVWEQEKRDLVEVSPLHKGMFDGCLQAKT